MATLRKYYKFKRQWVFKNKHKTSLIKLFSLKFVSDIWKNEEFNSKWIWISIISLKELQNK